MKSLILPIFVFFYFIADVTCPAIDQLKNIRNPFLFLRKKKKKGSSFGDLSLMGLVSCCQKKCAVLSCRGESCIMEKGQIFEGYKLVYIGENFITINKGKKKKKLYLE